MSVEDFLQGGRNQQPKRTTFEVLTQLILPLLLVLATVVSLLREQRVLAWVLVALVALSLVASFFPAVASWAKAREMRRSDELTARRAYPELRKFVEQFGEFVGLQRNDSLHYVVQSVPSGDHLNLLNKLGIPHAQLFYDIWWSLNNRSANVKPTVIGFKNTTAELSMQVSLYSTFCMRPIFETLPQEIRIPLTDRAKSDLEAFRERFVAFLNDYCKYLKHFDEGFASRYLGFREFQRPKPL